MREKRPNPGPSAFGETSPVGGPAQPSAAPQPEPGKGEEIAQPQVEAANVTPVIEQHRPASTEKLNEQELQEAGQLAGEPAHRSKLSILQIALIAGIVCSTAFLTYSLVRSSPRHSSPLQAKAEEVVQVSGADKSSAEQGKPKNSSVKQGDSADSSKDSQQAEEQAEPLSLKVAESHYEAKDYDGAYDVYERLRQNLTGPDYEMTRDFLLLEMGLCLERKGEYDNANQLFKKAALSRSVVTGVFANYHSSL
ncbi:MAG: tetratricopeptide repeat protein, partial [Sedimentisphaerales bacterium]